MSDRLSLRHIVLAMPSYQRPDPESGMALSNSRLALEKRGARVTVLNVFGESNVDDVRNMVLRDVACVDWLMGADDLVFLDDDVVWSPAALWRLLCHDVDFVAGVYPKREEGGGFPVDLGPEARTTDSGLIANVRGVPGGFLRLTRTAIARLYEHYGSAEHCPEGVRAFRNPADVAEDKPPQVILFERSFVDGQRLTGDYELCRKWRAIGGVIHVDPDLVLGHAGRKVWWGRLGDHLAPAPETAANNAN